MVDPTAVQAAIERYAAHLRACTGDPGPWSPYYWPSPGEGMPMTWSPQLQEDLRLIAEDAVERYLKSKC